jgi:spore maturation protein CgeB
MGDILCLQDVRGKQDLKIFDSTNITSFFFKESKNSERITSEIVNFEPEIKVKWTCSSQPKKEKTILLREIIDC